MPFHDGNGFVDGAANLNWPIGGDAYGIPRYCMTLWVLLRKYWKENGHKKQDKKKEINEFLSIFLMIIREVQG